MVEIFFACKVLPVEKLHLGLNDCVIAHVVHELQITETNDQLRTSGEQAGSIHWQRHACQIVNQKLHSPCHARTSPTGDLCRSSSRSEGEAVRVGLVWILAGLHGRTH